MCRRSLPAEVHGGAFLRPENRHSRRQTYRQRRWHTELTNHGLPVFQHCSTGDTSEYKDIEETIAPEILEIITTWLKRI
jgi:hypothetical protein